jgi:ribosome-binding factor A
MSRSESRHAGPSHRLERVGESIRHAMAEILQRGEILDPVLDRQAVTIPSVKMSPDLKLATVAVMPLGGENAEATMLALNERKKALRALVARRVNLKFAPDLRFVLDHSFSAQAEIDALLKSPRVARDLAHDDDEKRH